MYLILLIKMAKGKKGSPNQQQQINEQQINDQQNQEEIRRLTKQVEALTKRVDELETFKAISSKVTEGLRKEVDRLDQYGRRSNIVIRNIEKEANETQQQIEEKVHGVIATTLGLPNVISDIDKLHRFGKTKKDGRKTLQNVVVRFKSHRSRYAVYEKKKKLPNGYKMNAHLTNHRAKVLYESVDYVKDIEGVEFTFSNIHGDLCVWLTEPDDRNNHKFTFNTMDELKQILVQKDLIENDDDGNADE